jgi:hypothetical protein
MPLPCRPCLTCAMQSLTPFLSNPANLVSQHHIAPLDQPRLAMVGETRHSIGNRSRPRRPGHVDVGMGAAHGHPQGTRRLGASQLPRTPFFALRVTTVPGTRETPTWPRPASVVAREGKPFRHGRATHFKRPTNLGTAQPHRCRQEDRLDTLNRAAPSPSLLARYSCVVMVAFAAAPYLPPAL